MPSALVKGKHNKKLDVTIVKILVIVMTAVKEVNCIIIHLKRRCGGQEIAKVKSLGLIIIQHHGQ